MGVLNRHELLVRRQFKTVDVPIDDNGGVVRLQRFSGTDRDTWNEKLRKCRVGDSISDKGTRAYLVTLCAVDANGQKVFEAKDETEREQIAQEISDVWEDSLLQTVSDKAWELNLLGTTAVEDTAKNS